MSRSELAVLSCLRDSAQLSTLPAWCRGELSTAADLIDQLRQRVAHAEERRRQIDDESYEYAEKLQQAEAKLALADKWARAWRNRFIDERMAAYTEASYEMKRCYAESDANDFEAAFDATIDASGEK